MVATADQISNRWEDIPPLPVEDTNWVPLDLNGYDYRFTRRWFRSRNQRTFSTFLPPKFPGTHPVQMIQIGIWEGMDLLWQLQNTLKHPDSRAIAIDPWIVDGKHGPDVWNRVKNNAYHNLQPWRHKVSVIENKSSVKLQHLIDAGSPPCDLIVIDGDHKADAVYDDAVKSLQLSKVGGWLLFDDIRNRRMKRNHVYHGLCRFLDDFGSQVTIAWDHGHCICFQRIS